LAVRIQVGV
ncbi:putative formate transporter 1 domain protein, partial [Vibrio parahaemolyticus VP2007-007]